MNNGASERLIVAGGLTYLLLLGWAVENTPFDIWGALVLGPVYGGLGFIGMRQLFRGPSQCNG